MSDSLQDRRSRYAEQFDAGINNDHPRLEGQRYGSKADAIEQELCAGLIGYEIGELEWDVICQQAAGRDPDNARTTTKEKMVYLQQTIDTACTALAEIPLSQDARAGVERIIGRLQMAVNATRYGKDD